MRGASRTSGSSCPEQKTSQGYPLEVDVAISMASFHHFVDARKALHELRRVVKPGGRVYVRDIKAGRLFKHGSRSEEFRTTVSEQFPDAEFEDGSGYLVAKVRL
jgi:SAM-dependent methyltransferase